MYVNCHLCPSRGSGVATVQKLAWSIHNVHHPYNSCALTCCTVKSHKISLHVQVQHREYEISAKCDGDKNKSRHVVLNSTCCRKFMKCIQNCLSSTTYRQTNQPTIGSGSVGGRESNCPPQPERWGQSMTNAPPTCGGVCESDSTANIIIIIMEKTEAGLKGLCIRTYSITLPLSDGLSGQQKPPDRLYDAGFCATQHSGHYLLPPPICWPAWASGMILKVHGWPGRLNAALR